MVQQKVIESNPTVISARKAAEYLGINHVTFSGASKWLLKPQARIVGERRPALGYETAYLDEIDKVLPPRKQRGAGIPLFSQDVVEQIKAINERWEVRFPSMRD